MSLLFSKVCPNVSPSHFLPFRRDFFIWKIIRALARIKFSVGTQPKAEQRPDVRLLTNERCKTCYAEITKESNTKYRIRFRKFNNNTLLACDDFLDQLQDSTGFRQLFINTLDNGSEFKHYFFETVPFDIKTLNKPLEFALVDAPSLSTLRTNAKPFAKYLNTPSPNPYVTSFLSLGKDAVLIVPKRLKRLGIYADIATFMKYAHHDHKHALWEHAAKVVAEQVRLRKVWLSTHGHGVSYVHVRVDYRPKYYTCKEYGQM